ncbi:ATP-binding protein [Candidatus Woesearchaeota archaeon]|nr:ATP-binding protein [Candidatus Woesearchaeota archaeon]
MGRMDFIKNLRPLSDQESVRLNCIEGTVNKKRFKLIKRLLKQKKISIDMIRLKTSFFEAVEFPHIKALVKSVDASDVNKDIRKDIEKRLFEDFSKKVFSAISGCIAPNIQGMEHIKKAATLQLFSIQPIHILLLGDPSVGKTDILRAAFTLSPISSFGLGSGTSGAGLAVAVKGKDIRKGLLPLADKGICAIDELNLMKNEDLAALYNAMEKGFVSYDKGGNHYRFDARVKVLATANPEGDSFKANNIEELKKQMPFDPALLTRFHLTYIIKKPSTKEFKKITEKIISDEKNELSQDDIDFIKSYVKYTNKIEKVEFPKEMQKKAIDFIDNIKKNEDKYVIDVSPRLVIGFMRLCKALAKMEARTRVEEKDVERVKDVLLNSLIIKEA